MNIEEAKRILIACRPGTADERDAGVQEAFGEVARNDELAAWWHDQKRTQEVIRNQFRSLAVPENLKSDILARRKIVEIPWWRSTGFRAAAIAAVFVVLLSVIFWRPVGTDATFNQFRDRMVRTVIREYRMDLTNHVESELHGFLTRDGHYPDFQLPAQLKDVPLFGAGRLTWTGQPVSMICFERKPNVLMYLFVIDRSAFVSPPGAQPEFAEVAKRATASWSSGNRVYTLASDAGAADLKALMK